MPPVRRHRIGDQPPAVIHPDPDPAASDLCRDLAELRDRERHYPGCRDYDRPHHGAVAGLLIETSQNCRAARGPKIMAKGRYRDTVRSTDDQVVMTPGLKWVNRLLLTRVGWAGRHLALPFLTALAPSGRYDWQKGHRRKRFADYAQQMLDCLRRQDASPYQPASPRRPGQIGRPRVV